MARGKESLTRRIVSTPASNIVKKDFNGKEVAFRRSDDGELWLTAGEIGKALGYSHPNRAINQVFTKHRDEFTSDITRIPDTGIREDGFPPRRERIFNLWIWLGKRRGMLRQRIKGTYSSTSRRFRLRRGIGDSMRRPFRGKRNHASSPL